MDTRVVVMIMTLVLGLAYSALAAESAYTDLDIDACKTIEAPTDEPGGDFISTLCPGYGDYKVLFKEGDLRQSIHFGYLRKSIVDNSFETFGPFNHMNPKIEWRIKNGKPVAAIQRFFIENMNPETGGADKKFMGQVLVISKVGQPGLEEGCIAGLVDALANPEANVLARDVADNLAPGFKCGVDRATYHGIRGALAGEPAF